MDTKADSKDSRTAPTVVDVSTPTLREGDVYRFQYSDAARQQWRTDPYWCFDGQVEVRKGRLCDTYWGFDANEPRIVSAADGTLTFICNLGDVRDIREHEARHYAEADVFNLTHHHGYRKRFVVKKTAALNLDRMMREIADKEREVREEMERAVRSGASDLVRLGELRAAIDRGDATRKPWW